MMRTCIMYWSSYHQSLRWELGAPTVSYQYGIRASATYRMKYRGTVFLETAVKCTTRS